MQKRVKELGDRLEQDKHFYEKVQGDYRKTKEIVLFYQVLIYDILKRTELFAEGSKASDEDKVMFKEITELNNERMRMDRYEEQHSVRRDAKKTLNRLSGFVDEVHDILVTLDVKQLMKGYWKVMDEKAHQVSDLVANMAQVRLIPPALLPKESRSIVA